MGPTGYIWEMNLGGICFRAPFPFPGLPWDSKCGRSHEACDCWCSVLSGKKWPVVTKDTRKKTHVEKNLWRMTGLLLNNVKRDIFKVNSQHSNCVQFVLSFVLSDWPIVSKFFSCHMSTAATRSLVKMPALRRKSWKERCACGPWIEAPFPTHQCFGMSGSHKCDIS